MALFDHYTKPEPGESDEEDAQYGGNNFAAEAQGYRMLLYCYIEILG